MISGVLALLVGVAIWLLARTWHVEVIGNRGIEQLRRDGVPIVFVVWHAYLLAPLWHRRGEGITLLVSNHADASLLARVATRWGYGVVRGSTTRGAVQGFLGVRRALAAGRDVAFTPDGPRGPPRVAKPGALAAAHRSGAVLVPVGVAASSAWTLGTWDGFTVPRPFASIRVVYGPAVCPRDLDLAGHGMLDRLLAGQLEMAQGRARC